MWARISLCISVALAVLVVVLLAVFTPKLHNSSPSQNAAEWLDLSLYIQEPPRGAHGGDSGRRPLPAAAAAVAADQADAGALVFHRTLTEGPENTSRIVGKAQGFIIPAEHFARSGFNVVYLSFDTPQYSGSLGVRFSEDELTVVGGTGSFAFARGTAVFAAQDVSYHVKLQLRFPNNQYSPRAVPIPG